MREVREELRRYLGTARPEADMCGPLPRVAPRSRFPDDRPAEVFARASPAESSLYLNTRGLRPETLSHPRFVGTWRIGPRQNLLFAHTDDAGAVTGFEVKNHGFTGFAAGGRKTAWQSSGKPEDRALVITESAIDALSHHQLHPEERPRTRYLSTAGQPSRAQIDLLDRTFARLARATTVVAAVDADAAGHVLADRIRELAHRHSLVFRRDVPERAKDWNEVLQRIERDYILSLPRELRVRSGPER